MLIVKLYIIVSMIIFVHLYDLPMMYFLKNITYLEKVKKPKFFVIITLSVKLCKQIPELFIS